MPKVGVCCLRPGGTTAALGLTELSELLECGSQVYPVHPGRVFQGDDRMKPMGFVCFFIFLLMD